MWFREYHRLIEVMIFEYESFYRGHIRQSANNKWSNLLVNQHHVNTSKRLCKKLSLFWGRRNTDLEEVASWVEEVMFCGLVEGGELKMSLLLKTCYTPLFSYCYEVVFFKIYFLQCESLASQWALCFSLIVVLQNDCLPETVPIKWCRLNEYITLYTVI